MKEFFLNLIRGKSPYSIKKILSYLTFFLIVYIAIWTNNNYIDLLVFLSVLLGIRSYDKVQQKESNTNSAP